MSKFKVITDFPIAFDSPDHLAPHGTKRDNSSDELWINNIVDLFGRKRKMRIMDLGFAGGALVKDLLKHTPYVIGLEGSDYSIIHEREHWRQEDNLVNNNLFTCDVSRPFNIEYDNKPFLCDVITAWEVCEHIHPDRVEDFFKNIYNHLMPGGVFMGSVSNFSDQNVSEDGKTYELHQTAMPEEDWNLAIESTELFTIKKYDKSKLGYVREGHFLLYLEKKEVSQSEFESTDIGEHKVGQPLEERYNLDKAYDKGFFGWDNNAPQQKVLAEYFVPKIINYFNPKYVLDVGCATGQWLDEYRKYNIKTKGIEGSSNAWEIMSEETKKVVKQWDLRDVVEEDEEDYNIDFVQSFEVAEHIESVYADIFIHHLIKDDPDVILLTAALPDQAGHHHVNCQEREYWMKKMKDNGYLFDQDLLNEIKSWGVPDGCPFWWPSNLMVFV